jgi:hypothetical protein
MRIQAPALEACKPRAATAPLLLAAAGLSLLTLHCSSDPATPLGGAGTGTVATGGSGGGGGVSSQAGATSGGSSSGGMLSSGGASGGGTSGASGSAGAATGGSSGSSSGGASGGGGAGGGGGSGGAAGGVTFTQVASLLSASCSGGAGKCHNAGSKQMNWIDMTGLYTRLTSPIPDGIEHCVGSTPIVAGNLTNSILLQAVKGPGKFTCMKGAGTEMVARMPDDCSTTSANPRACLTDAQIKLISDWITAGAPQ